MSLIINPYRYGSGGPPTPPGLPPTSLTGLTFWYDGNNSPQYLTDTSTGGLCVADNDVLFRFDSMASIARVFALNLGNSQYKNPISGSNKGVRLYNNGRHAAYAQPAPGVGATSNLQLGAFVTATDAVIVASVKIVDAATNTGNAYNNPHIFGDTAGNYFGLCYYKSGTDVVFQAYNWDGNADVVTVTEPLSSWVVVTMRHSGGQLEIRKNGGSWASMASGNTTSITTGAIFGHNATDMQVQQFCTCNASNSDAAILDVEKYMGSFVGLTI